MTGSEEHRETPGDAAERRSAGQFEDPRSPGDRVLRDISAGMVRLYKEHFGRGPEAVETHFASPNLLVCILTNSLTPVERNLRDIGETQRLRDIRTLFQHVAEPQFRAIVETVSGRRVIGFMSGIDVNVDESCEVFTLAPAES
ncbi:MAG: hypothetical protein QOC86_414 [Gaiellales bacterium]|nr:hypothetical protein [Gaiellales bacterium]